MPEARVARKPIFRTLSSLDQYSDEFCRLLVRRLTGKSRISVVISATVNATAALMLACLWMLGGFLLSPVVWVLFSAGGNRPPAEWQWGVVAVAGAIGFVVSSVAMSRATALSALRVALAPTIIDGTKCLICRYSLEGLTGKDHLVVCPECGRTVPIGLGALDQVEQMIVRGELPQEGRFASVPRSDPTPNPVGSSRE
jgi:hypothetical protein